MKLTKKIIAVFLSILTLFSICSASTTVFAAEYTEQKARTEYFDSALSGYLKNIVDTEDAVSISEKKQVDETIEEVQSSAVSMASTFSLRTASVQNVEETESVQDAVEDLDIDHTRLTLELEDGENVAYLFSEPVSFIDDAGNLVYKDTNIRAVTDTTIINRGYSYENGDNDYKAYFSEDSSKGLLLVEKDGEEIRLVPNGTQSVGTVGQIESDMELVDSFEYAGVYGTDSVLRFLPQLNGCKEEIVLSSYQGISDFSFTLYTQEGTIAAINSKGEVEIIDSATKDIITTFVAPFANDSSGGMDVTSEHYTDCTYELEMISEGKYTLTISVPKEYLESENTVYPVVIDPTTDNITMTYDTSVYSALSDEPQSSNPTACFGKTNSSEYGKGRAMFYFKIPSAIEDYAKISSAKLWLRETTARTADMYVRPYIIKDSWNNTVTWDTKPSYKSTISYPTKSDLVMPRRNINSTSTDMADNPYWYAFDIIYAVKAWTTNYSTNRGLIFIAECEASDGDYLWRGFATKEYTTSSYRPYAVIKYTNDVTPPEITDVVKDPDDTYTNKNVTVTVTAVDNVYKEGGISKYSFNNGSSWQTSNEKTYKEEGTYTPKVIVKDLVALESDMWPVPKFIIDKTAPKITSVKKSVTSEWTNKDVKVTIYAEDALSGIKESKGYSFDAGSTWQTANYKTYTNEGEYTVRPRAKDKAGNIDPISAVYVKIDKTKPTVESVSGNPTSWTNADVTLKVKAKDTGGSGVASYSFDNGDSWQSSASKTFSKNQTVNIKVKDTAGNVSAVKEVKITKIDKTAPTVSVSSAATSASTKVTVTASDSGAGLHETAYSFDGGSTWQGGNTKVVTSTTTLSIKVRDKVGNIKTMSHTPSATLPITVTPSTTDWTNKNVRLTVTGTGISQYKFDSGSYSTTNYKDYSGNTTASITVKDTNGKTKTVTYKITNIDKTNPVISNVSLSETGWTDKDVSITVTASDALSGLHSTAYSFDGGKTWQASNTLTVSENGTYNVVVRDKATNKTTWSDTIIIDYIDKTDPVVPSVYEQDGTLYIYAPSLGETDGSPETLKYQIGDNNEDNYITVEGNSIELEVVRTYNVPVYAYVEDDAGNKAATTFTLENTLGEYTVSYTDIALGEGLFPVEFGRTYTSTNGWFFTFDANVAEIDEKTYVFTDFYGEKQYFIKNSKGQYLSVDEEELTIVESTDEETGDKIKTYSLNYGDMIVELGNNRKLSKITTDYTTTEYKWNTDGSLDITGGATVSFAGGKPTGIEIERENKKKTIEYNWTTEKILETDEAGNPTEKEIIRLTSFKDAAGEVHTYNYLGATELLTTNDTETITYSAQGRVKLISQPNGAFVKYTYNDNAENAEASNNVGAVTVSDSKGVTDTWYYADGVYISNTLDSYSDNAVYAPGEISAGITTDAISNIVYVVESEPQSEEQGTDEPSTGGEPESDGETATDNDIGEETNGVEPDTDGDALTDNEAEGEINGEENDAEQGEDNNAPSAPELPLYEAINENTYVFYDYDEQNRVATELTVLKSRIADITTATFEDAEKVVKAETVYVYASETDNTITDKYVFTYTDDVKLQTEELYQPINNVLFCVSKFIYDSNENIVLEQYFRPGTENETPIEYENCTRVYEGENLLSETQQTLVDGVLTTTKKLSYEYYENESIKTETQQTLVDGVLTDTKQLAYEYDIGDQLTSYTVKEYTLGALRTVSKESYNYNSFGNLEKEIIEEYTYVLNSNTNEYDEVLNTIETTYAYDIWNQQISITVEKTNESDSTTVITYDDLGNISTVTEDGVTVAYTYSNGNVSKVTETKELQQDDGTTVTKTVTSVYGYTDGNLVSRTNTTKVDEDVTETTVASYVYDSYGNLTNHAFNGYAFTYNTLGSILTANSESGQLVNYAYSSTVEQDVLNANFGNGQSIVYDYNEEGEITAIKLGEETKYGYEYLETTDENGEVTKEWAELTDYVSGIKKVIEESKLTVNDLVGNFIYSVENVSKDEEVEDSFNGTVTTIGSDVYTLVTEENKDTFKTNGTTDFTKEYTYVNDELNKTYTAGITTTYGYNAENFISILENTLNDVSQVYGYAYDEKGNITTETLTTTSKDENGATVETNEAIHYTYDDKEQLIAAETSSLKYEYTYDDRGNILTEKEYSISLDENNQKVYTLIETSTDTYVYDGIWKDKLISYNGQTITYDAVGNPINYMGDALTWTMGRQLASFGDISYTYNEGGIRTSKTANNVRTTFLLDGYNVIEQTDGTTTLHFFYDSNGEVIGFRYNENDYFYVKNAMSDIIAITDSNKNIVAEYRYDPWGKVIDEENLTAIGNLNPFRYRSYYYDSDIEMYYLQSRYYDAEVGRFINCDDVNYIGVTGAEVSYNPFAYCENNPVNYSDPNGCILITKFPKTWLNNFLRSLIGVEFENEKVIDSIEAIGIKIVLTQVVTKSRNPNAFFTFSNSSINASLGGLNFSLSKLSFSLSAEYSYKGVSVKSFAGASKTYIEFGLLVSQYFKTKNYKRSIGLEIAVQIKRALLKTMAVTIVATSLLLPQTAPFFGKAAIALTQLASSASSSIKTLTSAMLFVIWKAYA